MQNPLLRTSTARSDDFSNFVLISIKAKIGAGRQAPVTPVWRRPERSEDRNRRRGFMYAPVLQQSFFASADHIPDEEQRTVLNRHLRGLSGDNFIADGILIVWLDLRVVQFILGVFDRDARDLAVDRHQ